MAIQKKAHKDDAVSPVIGVMLMLVVTIVIAAVVAAFASGLGTDMESAPTVVLDANVYSNGDVKLTSLSGDNLVLTSTTVKVVKENGSPAGNAAVPALSGSSGSSFLTPGASAVAKIGTTLTEGTYVTVLVLYDGQHVLLNKELVVKKA